jgi:secreted trypsin-like serine protease
VELGGIVVAVRPVMLRPASLSVLFFGVVACTSAEPSIAESYEEIDSTIINGQTDNGHPAVAFLEMRIIRPDGKEGFGTCSATLVTPDTLLTAAHCVVPQPGGGRIVGAVAVFGTTALPSTPPEKVFDVKKMVAHPKYNPTGVIGDFDVAVIQLERPAPVAPIKVARTIGNLTGKTVVHVGWGASIAKSINDKSGGGTKRSVSLPITQQSSKLLRTGNGKSGLCNGDSGGPALLPTGGGDVVVGVHSYVDDAQRCAKNGFSARADLYVDFLGPFMASAFVDLAGAPPPPAPKAPTPKAPAKPTCDGDPVACFERCGEDIDCFVACMTCE